MARFLSTLCLRVWQIYIILLDQTYFAAIRYDDGLCTDGPSVPSFVLLHVAHQLSILLRDGFPVSHVLDASGVPKAELRAQGAQVDSTHSHRVCT